MSETCGKEKKDRRWNHGDGIITKTWPHQSCSGQGYCYDLLSDIVRVDTKGLVHPTRSVLSNTPPQVVCSSSEFMKCFTMALGNAFISMLAVMSSVGQ